MCIPAELPRPQVFLVMTTVIKCECAPAFEVVALNFPVDLLAVVKSNFFALM